MSERDSSGISGCGLVGLILAGYLSWTTFGKIGWAVIAALFNWLYVIYYALRYGLPELF